MDTEKIMQTAKKDNVKFVQLQFTDLYGIVKSLTIPVKQLPDALENGSGMHVHQSLFDIKTGKNAFYNEKDEYKLSKLAYNYIAGQLAHIKGMTAVLSPTVNSYKRLVPGYEAPVYIC